MRISPRIRKLSRIVGEMPVLGFFARQVCSALARPIRAAPGTDPEQLIDAYVETLDSERAQIVAYHRRRYQTALSYVPWGSGTLLDIGGVGIFPRMVAATRDYRVFVSNIHPAFGSYSYDVERHRLPHADEEFDVVVFAEVLEHLRRDPMHALSEINRILKPAGALVVTTPNIASWKAVHRILSGRHPALWSAYRPSGSCDRHNREYSFDEVRLLVETAGFEVVEMDALDVYDDGGDATPLEGYGTVGRGDTTFCLSRKVGAVADRWPSWLYDQGGLV